jgi:hypothetical protein
MNTEPDVELDRRLWLSFVQWYDESFHGCGWLPTLSGTNIISTITGKLIAYKTNIPEKYFVVNDNIVNSPWKKWIKK